MKLSIIIPAFNESKTIEQVIQKVSEIDLSPLKKEIIVIDDGSRDKTISIVSALQKNIRDLIIVKHKKNQGKGAAVATGIKRATGDILLIQDADLEYNPEDIPKLIKPLLERKAQVVYGVRQNVKKPVLIGRDRTPFIAHAFGNKLLSFITSLFYGYKISDMETGYKVINKNVLEGIKLKARSFDFEPEITAKILKKRIRIFEVPIKTRHRNYQEGKKLVAIKDGPIALWTLIKYKFID